MAEVCALLSVIQIVDDISVVTACASMTVLHCSQRMSCAVQELRSEIIPQISSAVASIHRQLDGE